MAFDINDQYNSIFTNTVKFADGTKGIGEEYEFVQTVDLLAHEYGLGGCKSLQEYADMVDETDPSLIHHLMEAIEERYENMYGTGDDKGVERKSHGSRIKGGHTSPSIDKSKMVDVSKDAKTNRNNIRGFLRNMGASKKSLDEAVSKIERGEIKISEEDFSWITPDVIKDPNFDLKGTMKKIREEKNKDINFKVSMKTLLERKV